MQQSSSLHLPLQHALDDKLAFIDVAWSRFDCPSREHAFHIQNHERTSFLDMEGDLKQRLPLMPSMHSGAAQLQLCLLSTGNQLCRSIAETL